MELLLAKAMSGLVPADQNTADYLAKVKLGSVLHGSFVKARNPKFHRKAFALLSMAFDLWTPCEVESKYGTPEKNFDRFRKDLTILAGFFKTTIRLDGTVRIEAESLSFGNMDNNRFEEVYQKFITVILKHVMTKYTREDVESAVQRILDFG